MYKQPYRKLLKPRSSLEKKGLPVFRSSFLFYLTRVGRN